MDISFKLEAFQGTALAASLTWDTLNSLLILFQTQTVIVYCNYFVQLDSLVLSIWFKTTAQTSSRFFVSPINSPRFSYLLCCARVLFMPTSPSSISQ